MNGWDAGESNVAGSIFIKQNDTADGGVIRRETFQGSIEPII